jgi:hypothetical protein
MWEIVDFETAPICDIDAHSVIFIYSIGEAVSGCAHQGLPKYATSRVFVLIAGLDVILIQGLPKYAVWPVNRLVLVGNAISL